MPGGLKSGSIIKLFGLIHLQQSFMHFAAANIPASFRKKPVVYMAGNGRYPAAESPAKQRCGGAAYDNRTWVWEVKNGHQLHPGQSLPRRNYYLPHAADTGRQPLRQFPKTLHVDFSMKQVWSIAGSTPAMESTSKPKQSVS